MVYFTLTPICLTAAKWHGTHFKMQLLRPSSPWSQLPLKTLVAHRAWSSVPAKMDPVRPIRPMIAKVVFSRFGGNTCLYRAIFFVQRLLRGSSRKGKENVYPVAKMTESMSASTVPSSKTAEVSVNSFTLVFTVIVPHRMQVGSSSFVMAFFFFL